MPSRSSIAVLSIVLAEFALAGLPAGRVAGAPPAAAPSAAAPANAVATGFSVGQTVEVREGDSWSAASIVRKEGRKYLIHYQGTEASADEWVLNDRVRASGSATDAA